MIQLVNSLDRKGGFARAIGQALLLADDANKQKLMDTFPEILEEKVRLTLVK
jgi:hypothetical protein